MVLAEHNDWPAELRGGSSNVADNGNQSDIDRPNLG
jgi:hypothetical protein